MQCPSVDTATGLLGDTFMKGLSDPYRVINRKKVDSEASSLSMVISRNDRGEGHCIL